MGFFRATNNYFKPQRTPDNHIIVYLAANQPPPINVPFELQGHVSPEAWAVRVTAITRVASQYNKPKFERIWALLSMLSIVIVPFVIYSVLLRVLNVHFDRFGNPQDEVARFWEARGISSGVFFGLMLLFILPIAVWKFIGQRRVNTMLAGWAKEDRILRGSAPQNVTWKVKAPGVFRPTIQLIVAIPATAAPTAFHPDAYLPSYLEGAPNMPPRSMEDPLGLPRMANVTYPDEKSGYMEDIDMKV